MPKVIHYFWEGGKKPRLVRKCIASWSRVMPDWEIKEWNLARLKAEGIDTACPFMDKVVSLKLWGFAIDVVRWAVLYKEGGVFLDADVELVKPLDELCDGEWMAAECDDPIRVNPGLGILISKGSTFAKSQLETYSTLAFDPARKFDFASAQITSPYLNRPDAPKVYPNVYFNPRGWSGGRVPSPLDQRTYAIHQYAGSWWNLKQKLVYTILPRLGLDVGKWLRALKGLKDDAQGRLEHNAPRCS